MKDRQVNQIHIAKIASELSLRPQQAAAAAELLEDGATIPFIARYRKEATGSLDEVALTSIRDRLNQLKELDARRESIIKSLEERGQLTEELSDKIMRAETMTVLEDIYLPYRPKRRTRATIAREKGLEPLAELIFAQDPATNPEAEAEAFVDEGKGVESVEAALAGAADIIAEKINEDQTARARIRDLFFKEGCFRSKVVQGKEAEGCKYEDYFDWEEPVAKAPSHRILAMRRGDREEFLRLQVEAPQEQATRILEGLF
ncbi:MAG: Tex-like N-terminal domain-containing protein, partial [Planctomycetota bacterium]